MSTLKQAMSTLIRAFDAWHQSGAAHPTIALMAARDAAERALYDPNSEPARAPLVAARDLLLRHQNEIGRELGKLDHAIDMVDFG
jgi:hypothetical protein